MALCAAQNVDPKLAKILKEQRFNAGDGRAGSAFATEDGVIFKEETDINGNRIGQYSYVGEDGQTYVVKYSAGKDGFRILSGDHIPSTGQNAAPFLEEGPADPAAPVVKAAPAPRPAPRPAPAVQQVRQAAPAPQLQQIPAQPAVRADPNANPFINPHDPTHRNFQFNQHAAQFNPNSPGARQASLVPDCADCAGVNPFVNPFDASHQQGAGVLAGVGAGVGAGLNRPAARRVAPAPAAAPPPGPSPRLSSPTRPFPSS